MSLIHLQKAVATLIRFPEDYRENDVRKLAKQFDLTQREQDNLLAVASNPQVQRYGKKLRLFRYNDTAEALPLLQRVLGETLFEQLWFERFEPEAAHVPTEDLAYEFLNFLVSNDAASAILRDKASPFLPDLVSFLFHELSMEHKRDEWLNKPPPPGSLLVHGAICPLALRHDIPAFLKQEEKDESKIFAPRRRRSYYLLTLSADREQPRLFAVDRSVFLFFEQQLQGPAEPRPLPKIYGDLVKSGLCRPVEP